MNPLMTSPWSLWPYMVPMCRHMWWHHGRHGDMETPQHTLLWKHMWNHIPPQRTHPSMGVLSLCWCRWFLKNLYPFHQYPQISQVSIAILLISEAPLWSPQLIYGPPLQKHIWRNTSSVEAQNEAHSSTGFLVSASPSWYSQVSEPTLWVSMTPSAVHFCSSHVVPVVSGGL